MMESCDPDEFAKPQHLICVLNGALDPLTGTLLEHDHKFRFANRLEVDWAPGATCELWLLTLDQIFAPDEDKAAKIAFLQEFMGYCLIPDTTMHKFVWMVGRGGNGKSLVLSVLEDLVGPENVSHAQLDRLQDKFARSEIQGKLVNISSEMSAQATVSDGYLKQIVAGDKIEAERKYQPSFSFKPTARLVGATNELPRLLDQSDGFFRRAAILTFNRQFTEAEQDRTRIARLREELPGILVWAVQGLQRLKARGTFVIPSSSNVALAQYRIDSDPVQQFAEDFLQRTANQSDWVTASSLYAAFKDWASDSGYRTMNSTTFKARLTALGYIYKKLNTGRYWQVSYSGGDMRVDRLGSYPTWLPRVSPPASTHQL
jgi:putative DNA primase/helicase